MLICIYAASLSVSLSSYSSLISYLFLKFKDDDDDVKYDKKAFGEDLSSDDDDDELNDYGKPYSLSSQWVTMWRCYLYKYPFVIFVVSQ